MEKIVHRNSIKVLTSSCSASVKGRSAKEEEEEDIFVIVKKSYL